MNRSDHAPRRWSFFMARQALFAGLVYDEYGNLVETNIVGDSANYIVNDDGFLRHIDSEIYSTGKQTRYPRPCHRRQGRRSHETQAETRRFQI